MLDLDQHVARGQARFVERLDSGLETGVIFFEKQSLEHRISCGIAMKRYEAPESALKRRQPTR